MNIKHQKEKALKTAYRKLYGNNERRVVPDAKIENFKWSYVPVKEKNINTVALDDENTTYL